MSRTRHPAYYLYLAGIILSGSVVLTLASLRIYQGQPGYQWIILASLTVITGTFTIKIPGVDSKISVADTFLVTNLILFGADVGAVTAALDGLIGSLRTRGRARRLEYALFNISSMALSAYLAGLTFFWLIGRNPLYEGPTVSVTSIILPMAAMALVHYATNAGSVATIVALDQWKSMVKVWRESSVWTSITHFVGAAVAGVIVLNINTVTPAVLGVITPVLLIIYYTYKTYLDKLEANNRSLNELNKLYLNTLEILAMAIDAKDQVTHGHVRRVQVYTRGLARAMGITDEDALRGLEAAALLHDIGKLAIPEYILNKPGDLTRSEYRKMQIHPGVGADILASIDFPYPVADYVRHHHEHWDGSGYPDKLKGTQIPLGARVLAVADCYEALTCDRPFRARFTREKAMQIIQSRAGKQFDPQVVEKFDSILDALTEEVRQIEAHELNLEGLKAIAETARDSERMIPRRTRDSLIFQDISSTHREVLALYELAQTLGSTLDLHETLLIIAGKVEKIVPFTTCVIYLYSASKGSLTAERVTGANIDAFKGYTIGIGERLTGWAAAHSQPAINADPAFDLAPIKDKLFVPLNNALVYPLNYESKCLGTISLYAAPGIRFSDDHARVMEVVSKQAATAIYNAMKFEETQEDAFTDRLTSLPNSRYLHIYFEQELQKALRYQYPLTLMEMDLDGFKEINDCYGHPIGDRMLLEVGRILKANLRGSDVVVRYAGDEFVAVMSQTGLKDAALLARRLQMLVEEFRLEVRPGKYARVGISVGLATYPRDGESLDVLMVKADEEMYRDKEDRRRKPRVPAGEPKVRQLELKSSANK